MFKALVELSQRLEKRGELPPTGFYEYGMPIKWVVHLAPEGIEVEKTELAIPRPFSGRTNKIEAHLLVDEAAYCLGVDKLKAGERDSKAVRKHEEEFRPLYRAFLASQHLTDPAMREAVGWLDRALDDGRITRHQRFSEIRSKDWVSFKAPQAGFDTMHLFQHLEARSFWVEEMRQRCALSEEGGGVKVFGQCSVCGRVNQPLVRKLPLKVRLAVTAPLHSLNADAFTSFLSGSDTSDRANLGICFLCGDGAARAFNKLSDPRTHRRRIAKHPDPKKNDALANMFAIAWVDSQSEIDTGDEIFDPSDLDWTMAANDAVVAPPRTLSQILALLEVPWKPRNAALRLDDFGFYLAILSPNVGRVAVRDWFELDIRRVKRSLHEYLAATLIVSAKGDSVRPVSVASICSAIDSLDADLERSLIRTAYTGSHPPSSLVARAGQRLTQLITHEFDLRERQQKRRREQSPVWRNDWPRALAGAIKLGSISLRRQEGDMTMINESLDSVAYHCGRVLAVLEEAQQIYTYLQYGKRLDVSLVQRGYGGAATTPGPVIGRLFTTTATAHLPVSGQWMNEEMNAISSRIAELGGMPSRLSLVQQAEFGLGFFQERARIRSRPRTKGEVDAGLDEQVEDEEAIDEETEQSA